MGNNEILAVKNLCKSFENGRGNIEALKNVNMSIKEDEFLIIMGTSGSGKSTLLNIIGALDSPTGGEIKIGGEGAVKDFAKEPFATRYRSENIGFIFQDFNLLKDLSVEENIALPLILDGEEEDVISQKVGQQLELVGLKAWRRQRPVKLSGGQKQRVAIARALVMSPRILLADEPTGNLDYNTSKDVLNVIVQAKTKLKQSILLVTHDPMVASYGDRVVFFHDGEIVDEHINSKSKDDVDSILEKFRRIMEE